MNVPPAIRWDGGRLSLLDQRKLPGTVTYLELASARDVADAIRNLVVRGAPAIGIAAAYGLVVEMQDVPHDAFEARLAAACGTLVSARPTAVNLAWAVERAAAAARNSLDPLAAIRAEAEAIHAEDTAMCLAIGEHGAPLIGEGAGVLTHCNAGALAVSAHGTATAPMYRAHALGRRFGVYVDETRPVLQGARLTAWELAQAGLDVTLVCDNNAAHLMAEGVIDLVIVGTDRVVRNGDVVNKIGTRGVAIAARYHGVPFYVACPSSTFDASTATGADVPIEERPAEEVTAIADTVPGIKVRNPAFDVTPAALVTAWITDRGVFEDPEALARALS